MKFIVIFGSLLSFSLACEGELPAIGGCPDGYDEIDGSCCLPPSTDTSQSGDTAQPGGNTDMPQTQSSMQSSSSTQQTPGSCEDLLNPKTGVSDCPALAYLCTDSVYYDLMTEQCPKTCNRCGGGGGGGDANCVDKVNPKTGVSDCPQNAGLCDNSVYYSLMTDQCPKTCNRCNGGSGGGGGNPPPPPPSGGCQDKTNPTTGVSDCPQNAGLCNNSLYQSLMRDQCPKTCGFC